MVKNKLSSVLGVFFLLTILIINMNMTSAFEFDNVGTYDPIKREVTITNAFGLGSEIGKARLNTPLIVDVPTGYQKVAEFDLWAYEDYNDILKSIDLYDKNQKDWEKNKFERNIDIKYRSFKDVEVDDFKFVCITDLKSLNETEICNKEKVGTYIEKQEVWKKVTPAILKKNEFVTVGLFTNVEYGDRVEWIPSIYGVQVPQWAEWTSDLNTSLITYYDFEDTTGNLLDKKGSTDLVETGTINSIENGIWENARGVYATPNYFIGDLSATISTSAIWSISIWYNITANDTYRMLYETDDTDNTGELFMNVALKYSKIWVQPVYRGVLAQEFTDTEEVNQSVWNNLVIIHNSSGGDFYIYNNGVFRGTTGTLSGGSDPSIKIVIGKGYDHDDPFTNGYLDEMAIWQRGLNLSEIDYIWSGGIGAFLSWQSQEDFPSITLNSPSSANYTTAQNIQMNFTASDDINLSDVKLYVNNLLNQTNASGLNNTVYLFNLTLGEGDYTIYGKATDNASQETNSSSIRIVVHINHSIITPATNLTNLITLSLPINSTWSFNASDPYIDKCYYNTTEQNTTVVTCNSTIQTAWTTQGNKTVTYCANDTFGFEDCQSNNLYVYYIQETQAEDLDPVGEGTDVTFNFIVNMTNIPSTTAYLVLNNTQYAATTSIAGTNGYYFERSVVIPDGWGSPSGEVIDWNWVYNISGILTNEETDTTNITVYSLSIDDCSSYGERILNISLKDEEQNTLMFPPTVNNTKIEIDLEIIAKDNSSLSWDYSTTWDDDADGIVGVCIPLGILNNSEYRFDFTMGFKADNYVQEFYYLDNGTLDSNKQYTSLTNDQIDLFDLLLVDSTTFIFKFFDEDSLEVSDGIVHVFRKYIGDGVFREVERGKQDNNGETHLHLVEEDVIYYFKVSLDGTVIYTSSTYNAKCLSTPCQIELEASGEFQEFDSNWDLANGSYSVTNNPSTRQVILTYALNNPETMNLTIFKYTNNPDTMEVVGSDQAYSTGGTLTVTIPQVAGNVSFIAAVYQGGEVINVEWVDFNNSGRDYFGATGIFMALLLLISLILMASSEGEGTLIFAIVGLILISTLKLIDLDYYALVGFICASAILIWKIAERRKR